MSYSSGFASGGGLLKKYDIRPGGGVRTTIKGGRGGLTASAIDSARRAKEKREDEQQSNQEQVTRIAENRARNAADELNKHNAMVAAETADTAQRNIDREFGLKQQKADDKFALDQQAQWNTEANAEVARLGLTQDAQQKQQKFDMENDYRAAAMSLVTGDPSGVVDYMNRYGNVNANLEGINRNEDGSYSVMAEGQLAQVTGLDGALTVQREQGKEVGRFASAKDMYTQFFGKVNPARMGEAKQQKRITENHYIDGRKQLEESYDGGQTWSPVREAEPLKAAKVKGMTSAVEKRLTSASQLSDHMDRLSSSFIDDYGDSFIGGIFDIENRWGRTFGDSDGQAQWWQDYQVYLNDVRHDKFGSALTATEKGEFLKAAITPRMDSEQIRANLKRQQELASIAIDRLSRGYAVDYNPEAISAITGREISGGTDGEQQPQRPPEGDFSEPKVDAEGKYWVRIGGQLREVEM